LAQKWVSLWRRQCQCQSVVTFNTFTTFIANDITEKGSVRPGSKTKHKHGTGVADDFPWHIMNGLSPDAQVDALVRHILEGQEDQLEEDSYATIIDVITYDLRTVEHFGRPEEYFAELVELDR
jgi:hypothetical protein